MKHYAIAEDNDKKKLMDTVTKYLNLGWECQGGVTVVNTEMSIFYIQALIKIVNDTRTD